MAPKATAPEPLTLVSLLAVQRRALDATMRADTGLHRNPGAPCQSEFGKLAGNDVADDSFEVEHLTRSHGDEAGLDAIKPLKSHGHSVSQNADPSRQFTPTTA